MRIHNENQCSVCCKPFKYRNMFHSVDKEVGIKEVEMITAHATCRSLVRKKKEKEAEILDIEWRLFCLKHGGNEYI